MEQKGFELLELRGDDPRLSSLDTLSGGDIPLHLLLRLHGFIIQVGETSDRPDQRFQEQQNVPAALSAV